MSFFFFKELPFTVHNFFRHFNNLWALRNIIFFYFPYNTQELMAKSTELYIFTTQTAFFSAIRFYWIITWFERNRLGKELATVHARRISCNILPILDFDILNTSNFWFFSYKNVPRFNVTAFTFTAYLNITKFFHLVFLSYDFKPICFIFMMLSDSKNVVTNLWGKIVAKSWLKITQSVSIFR